MKTKLRAGLIEETARREWADPESLSSRNFRSIPPEARDGFAIAADMSGICVLDPSGKIRVFLHQDQREIEAAEWVVRGAFARLERDWPHLFAGDDDDE
ncbi:MAG: hypothetical protein KC731_12200 [Myxococcales bacterium]|nr:hypothetical protein [Myxococcales bacterium]